MSKVLNIFADFDTTAVRDPEREYYNLPRNTLPVLNQITGSARITILEHTPAGGKLVFSTTGIDGYGYNDNTFNLDTFYFKNQIIYFTVRVKTENNFPAKFVNKLNLGNGIDNNTVSLTLVDENDNTLSNTFSSNFGTLTADTLGGFFKGSFQYNGTGNNLKIKGIATSKGVNNIIGESNTFNVIPVSGNANFRKINEDNDQKQNFINYLYQPNLKSNPNFFNNFIGQIVGDANDPSTLGVKVYEKISNFLINSNDTDFANIDNLISNMKLIDSNVNKFSNQYPSSLKRIIDFFSVNRSKLIPVKNKFNFNFNSKGRSSLGLGKNLGNKIELGDTLSGGDNFKPIVALEKFSNKYQLLNTDPTSSFDFRYLGENSTYQISSYNIRWGWGLALPDGVGDFINIKDEVFGKNLILESKPALSGSRILSEEKGISTEKISDYYKFFEFIPTTDDKNISTFYDDANNNSNLDTTTLSSINSNIDEIILKDIYTGTNLI